jgi:hypothetical protein
VLFILFVHLCASLKTVVEGRRNEMLDGLLVSNSIVCTMRMGLEDQARTPLMDTMYQTGRFCERHR